MSKPKLHSWPCPGILALFACVALAGTPAAAQGEKSLPGNTFLKQHCLNCHDSESKKGGLDLTSVTTEGSDPRAFALWVKVHDKVRDGEMPPGRRQDRLDPRDTKRFLVDLNRWLTMVDSTRQAKHGRGVIRRLNRVEFETALSDLLGVPLRIRELLPPDARGEGFDTVGAALNVSAVQMESYLKALDVALDCATTRIKRPKTQHWQLSYLQTTGMMTEYRRTGPFLPLADGVAMFAPDAFSHFNSLLDHFVIPHNARYRVKVTAYAIRTRKPITLTVRMGGPGHKESDEVPKKLLGNVSVRTGKPQVFEFEDHLERGQMFRIYPSSLRKMRFEGRKWMMRQKEYKGPAVVVQKVEVEGPLYESWPPPSHQRLYAGIKLEPIPGVDPNDDPNAHLNRPPDRIAKPRMTARNKKNKTTGNRWIYDPKQGVGGEKIYRRTRVNRPLHPTIRLVSKKPKEDAERLLRAFIPRAYRRPVTEAAMRPFIKMTHHWLDQGVAFEEAMRAGYKAVLVSPGFLYHQGGRVLKSGKPELDDYELAERLAFFLWSSLPDQALLQVASQGKLHQPETLRAQVERMLQDPRAERFLENFLGQWLDLRLIDFTSPDSDLYPEHDALLQWSMVEETKTFFRELLVNDLSVQSVIRSDFAMLNDRLARHYGIPGVEGIKLRRVMLPKGSVRGGVMTQASVLKVTANGTTTSPVVRGTWLMERIVGQTPEPPPPGVPAIEPDIRGATTVREQLQKHRSIASCARCHAKIDPLGMALENFDVIGGWRENYRALDPNRSMRRVAYTPAGPPRRRYIKGPKVEANDELPDGRQFADVREFKKLLLANPDQVAEAVTKRLIIYATGARISFADRAAIREIVHKTRPRKQGFRSLIHEVVQSPLFRRK